MGTDKKLLQILVGDALEKLRELPDESVNCCVTSPPYWGLRDYGTAEWEGGDDKCDHGTAYRKRRNEDRAGDCGDGGIRRSERDPQTGSCKCGASRIDSQLGLEKTPEEYVAKMVEVFSEVRRVLRKDGTLWLNLGDSYANDTKWGGTTGGKHANGLHGEPIGRAKRDTGLKSKDLCGIPWRVAFALQADGWYLRQDIIWAKPNPMPESVTDRCTKAHEYMFLLTKSARYFYDAEAIKEGKAPSTISDLRDNVNGHRRERGYPGEQSNGGTNLGGSDGNRNKRSVWTVATAPYPEAHFATYPPDLIKPCILAGTSAKGCCAKCGAPWGRIVEPTLEYALKLAKANDRGDWYPRPGTSEKRDDGTKHGKLEGGIRSEYKTLGWQPTCVCHLEYSSRPTIPGTVLDPFAGSGTTGQVALELGRKAILIELNPKYAQLIRDRCNVTPGLALAV